ncbi:PAS domain S-box protein, partial [candidate division KSB3 bacterium]|nr:PAS domain S-box protein [candidate division KSB3 bacterium]MBD3327183.1 PAS domain S-box protein [candidate division KSB3 bacterium]
MNANTPRTPRTLPSLIAAIDHVVDRALGHPHGIMGLALGLGLCIWGLDTVLDWLVYYQGQGTFLEILITDLPAHEIYIRPLILACFVLFGGIMGRYASKRKQAEEALRQSEERFRAVWEITADALVLSDSEGTVLTANSAYLQLYGYTEEEVVGKNFAVIFPEDQRQMAREQYRTVFAAPDIPPAFDAKIQRSDGAIRSVESRIGFLTNTAGHRQAMLSSIRDITERKNAEETLKESLIDLKLAQQIAHVGNWQFDPEVGIPVWSEQVYKIYNRDPTQGPPHIDEYKRIYEEDQFAIFNAAIQRAIHEGKPYDIILKLKLPGGIRKWVHTICQPDEKQGKKGYFLRGTIQDITERVEIEHALRESEARLRQVIDLVPHVIFARDRQGRHILVNQTAAALHHTTPEAMLGKTHSELPVFPQEYKQFLATDQKLLKTGQPMVIPEETFTLPDERQMILQVTKIPYRLFGTDEQAVLGIAIDITARKQAEQALKESEEKFQTAFHAAPVSLCISTLAEGIFLDVNAEFLKLTGYTREEVIGHHASELGLWQTQSRDAVISELQAHGYIRDMEVEILNKSGTPILLMWYADLVTLNKQPCLIVTSYDLTERKQAEAELVKNQTILQEAEKVSAMGSFEWDLQHDQITCSDGWLRIHGCERRTIPIEDLVPIAHPDDRKMIDEAWQQALEGIQPYDLEHRIIRQNDGEIRVIKVRGRVVFDASGTPLKMYGSTQDITERKRAEHALKAALAEKDVLLQEVHHRVKNNLQLIHSLLYKQQQYVHDAAARLAFDESMNRVHSMALIHEQIYRSEDFAHINLADYIREFASSVFHTYRPPDQALSLSLELDEDLTVALDLAIPVALVLNELLTNALKYAFPANRSGEIAVTCRE